MRALELTQSLGERPVVLCLGAHPDDIEIGCGGTVLQLAAALPRAEWHWLVLTGNALRHEEARQSARRFLGEGAETGLHLESFRDGFLPWEGAAVKERFESLKREIRPDLIFTHHRHDRHQDHRLVGELTWNTWRDHLVFEYEIPKYEGDLGQPQSYVPLDAGIAEKKADAVIELFPSQKEREWFDRELLLGLMRVRGAECNAPSRHAEAFHVPKWTISLSGSPR